MQTHAAHRQQLNDYISVALGSYVNYVNFGKFEVPFALEIKLTATKIRSEQYLEKSRNRVYSVL